MVDTLSLVKALRGNAQKQVRMSRLLMVELEDKQKQAEADWNAAMGADQVLAVLEGQLLKDAAPAAADPVGSGPVVVAEQHSDAPETAPKGEKARDGRARSKG